MVYAFQVDKGKFKNKLKEKLRRLYDWLRQGKRKIDWQKY